MTRARRPAVAAGAAVAVAVAGIAALLVVRNAVVSPPLERLALSERDGWVVREGSWRFPRGGPYILGYEAAAEARLFIDGRRVAAGAGRQTVRRVYEPGVAGVRLEVRAGAGGVTRLLWHPPGRRGPLEYVPPSSLAPEPPARAVFGRWAGAAPVDGLVSGLIALILVGLCLYLARGVIARADRRVLLWAAITALLALGVRLWDLDGAGQTWDEDVSWSAGRNYVTNWLSLDFRPGSWEWNQEHPPVMKYIAGIGAQWADGYDPARALSALLVALGCGLLVPIGRRLFSLRAGALAGVAAALSPHLIAHGKVVGHEAPTVLWWALGIWLALRAHDPPAGPPAGLPATAPRADRAGADSHTGRDPLPARLAVIGLVVGLAVFSRFVNGLLGVLAGAILLIMAPPGRRTRTLGLGLAIAAPVAVAVGFAVWPRLWDAPIAHLQEAWATLRRPHAPEPFLGQITNTPPRFYFAVYLVATAPAGLLAGFLLWIARAARRGRAELRATLILALWLLVPMIVALSPVRQDGVRYIMPCLLALALAAAAGLDAAASWAASAPGALGRRAFAGLAGVLVLYLAVAGARIHPYYLDYYGEHVGGPAGVAERKWFEVAWWGEGIADAIGYVNRHAPEGARVFKRCVEPSHLTWLRADLWAKEARRPEQADWLVVYQPAWRHCPVPAGAALVHEVSAQGAPLVRVYRVE